MKSISIALFFPPITANWSRAVQVFKWNERRKTTICRWAFGHEKRCSWNDLTQNMKFASKSKQTCLCGRVKGFRCRDLFCPLQVGHCQRKFQAQAKHFINSNVVDHGHKQTFKQKMNRTIICKATHSFAGLLASTRQRETNEKKTKLKITYVNANVNVNA